MRWILIIDSRKKIPKNIKSINNSFTKYSPKHNNPKLVKASRAPSRSLLIFTVVLLRMLLFVVELLLFVALRLLLLDETDGSGVMNDDNSLGGPPFMCFVEDGVTEVADTVDTFSGWAARLRPRVDLF